MLKKITLYLLLFLSYATGIMAQDFPARPEPIKFVNDFTGLFGGNTAGLEAKLSAYNDSTSTQIAVVTVASLNGYEVKDYAQRLGQSWGIGQKGKNNGVIILIAPHKICIETGYGMEATLPDAKAKWIINNIIGPAFKGKNYVAGIDGAINEIISGASGEYSRNGSEVDKKRKSGSGSDWIWLLVLIGFIAFTFLRKRSGGGGFTSYSSGGSYYGGSSYSGGGSSSFGGSFGGGSFGGGGASGDW